MTDNLTLSSRSAEPAPFSKVKSIDSGCERHFVLATWRGKVLAVG